MLSTVIEQLLSRLERITRQMEQLQLDAFLRYAGNWRRRLLGEFLAGIARGIGFSVGFTILGAVILYFLRNAAMSNLPVIGRFVAEIVRIVEHNL